MLSGAQIEFQAGKTIFEQGDPGGDLYLLKEGEVEVFRGTAKGEVRLAVLKQGEVLGIMTCLTRDPRLASARALTDVKALVVKQAGFNTLISSTPPWVHTVIKDFIFRIKNMDDLYTRAYERLEEQAPSRTNLRLACTIATGLGELGALMAQAGTQNLVDIDQVLAKLARMVDQPLSHVQQVFAQFVASGALRVEQGARTRTAELPVLQRLGAFRDLCHRYLDDKTERAAWDALSLQDLEAMASGQGKDPRTVALYDVTQVRYLMIVHRVRAMAAAPVAADRLAVQIIAENF
jgi:CRP-like cAMP-binding protein